MAQDTQEVSMTSACGLQSDSVTQNFAGGLIYFFVVCKSELGPFRSHIDLKVAGRFWISPSLWVSGHQSTREGGAQKGQSRVWTAVKTNKLTSGISFSETA